MLRYAYNKLKYQAKEQLKLLTIIRHMEIIKEKLQSLGLSQKEAEIYLVLIKLKSATAVQLSKKTGIKRTTLYYCLDNLIFKGLIYIIEKDDKKIYIAEDPKESLRGILEEKKSVINSLSLDLKNIFGESTMIPEIKIYRNTQGLKKIFEGMLDSREKVIRCCIFNNLLEETLGQKFVDEIMEKRIKAGIACLSLRGLNSYLPPRELPGHAKQLRKVKFLPAEFQIKPYIAAYDNRVVIISGVEEKVGFTIESKELADSLKTLFDALWNSIAV